MLKYNIKIKTIVPVTLPCGWTLEQLIESYLNDREVILHDGYDEHSVQIINTYGTDEQNYVNWKQYETKVVNNLDFDISQILTKLDDDLLSEDLFKE